MLTLCGVEEDGDADDARSTTLGECRRKIRVSQIVKTFYAIKMLLNLLNAIKLDIWSHNMSNEYKLEYKTFMKLFCKGQFLLLISGEDRDEPLLPMVGEEIDIEAEESQDQGDRDDNEHQADDLDPILDNPLASVTKKSDIHYHHTSFIPTWESPTTHPHEQLTPYGHFKQNVPSEMFELMSMMTNIYAEQNGVRGYEHASASEIEIIVGLHMAMGVLGFPTVRMYSSSAINIGIFRDTMSQDRFFQFRSNLHVVNNYERPPGQTTL